MMVYIVTYDEKRGQSYQPLYDAIRKSPGYCHAMYSMWFIATWEDPAQLRNRLASAMHSGDRIYVADVSYTTAAWVGLSTDVNDWLKLHVPVPITTN